MFNCCYLLPLPGCLFFYFKVNFLGFKCQLGVASGSLQRTSAASWAKRAPKQKRGIKRRGGRAGELGRRRARGRGSVTGRQIRQPLYSPFNTLYYFFISLSFSGENIHKKPVRWEAVSPFLSLSLFLFLTLSLSQSSPRRGPFAFFFCFKFFPLDSSSTIHLDIQQWVREGRSWGKCCFWNLLQPKILTTTAATMKWEICVRIIIGNVVFSERQLSVVTVASCRLTGGKKWIDPFEGEFRSLDRVLKRKEVNPRTAEAERCQTRRSHSSFAPEKSFGAVDTKKLCFVFFSLLQEKHLKREKKFSQVLEPLSSFCSSSRKMRVDPKFESNLLKWRGKGGEEKKVSRKVFFCWMVAPNSLQVR